MDGRNVLIIGGSRGIGAEAVRQFRAEGCNVVFTYHRSELEADALRQETGAVPVRCDVKFGNSVKIAVDKAQNVLGHIDVLICSAATADSDLITDIEETRWEEVIDTDLNGVFYCVRNVLPLMIQRKSGTIITVSSMWGPVGAPHEVACAAARAGVIGLTKALAGEVGPSGINVTCVAPGLSDTDRNLSVSDGIVAEIPEKTPSGGTAGPGEVASVMRFLASEEAGSVNGQVVGVTGGPAV